MVSVLLRAGRRLFLLKSRSSANSLRVSAIFIHSTLKERGGTSQCFLRRAGIVLGFYFERSGIVHRDIKPENIFINDRPLTLKIGDFGLARFIEAKTITETQQLKNIVVPEELCSCLPSRKQEPSAQWLREKRHNTPFFSRAALEDIRRGDSVVSVKGLLIGTPGYTAPEGGALCTEKADVFSASLILLELLCPRFKTAMERYKTLENFRLRQKVRLCVMFLIVLTMDVSYTPTALTLLFNSHKS